MDALRAACASVVRGCVTAVLQSLRITPVIRATRHVSIYNDIFIIISGFLV